MIQESEKLTLNITRAGELLGISRPQAYRLAKNGTLPILYLGHRMVVPKAALERMLNEVKPTVS
jgi:excisionase family DNA binding protein